MADYSAYDAGDQISVVSGAPSFINQLSVDFHGTNCLDTPDFNKAINVENLIESTNSYSQELAGHVYIIQIQIQMQLKFAVLKLLTTKAHMTDRKLFNHQLLQIQSTL